MSNKTGPVTDSDIRALLDEARQNDDAIMIGLCRHALGLETWLLIGTGYAESSPDEARAECERVIRYARAEALS